jgi:hypothetical protein
MAADRVPSRITILEENMDWLTNTPFLSKRAGFFADKRGLGVSDGI